MLLNQFVLMGVFQGGNKAYIYYFFKGHLSGPFKYSEFIVRFTGDLNKEHIAHSQFDPLPRDKNSGFVGNFFCQPGEDVVIDRVHTQVWYNKVSKKNI